MKHSVTIEFEATPEQAAKLKTQVEQFAAEELRKLRREFRVGDWVLDRYGQRLHITTIYDAFGDESVEYELRNEEYVRAWKGAKDADIKEIL